MRSLQDLHAPTGEQWRKAWRAAPNRTPARCRSRPRSSSVQKVGDYFQFTVVAPGIAHRVQAGPLRRGRGRRREHLDAAAPGVRALRRDAERRLRRHDPVRRRRARPGHAVADAAPGRRRRSTSSARSAHPFPLPPEPSPAVLVGGGYGTAPLIPLAQALLDRGSPVEIVLGASTGDAAVRRARRQADWSARSPSPPTTASAGARGGSPTCCRDAIERINAEVVYACGPDADAARGRHTSPADTGIRGPGRGRGVDGLRHRRLHDLRAAGARRRRPVAVRPLVRGRAGVRRRPTCAGTTSGTLPPDLVGADAMGGALTWST